LKGLILFFTLVISILSGSAAYALDASTHDTIKPIGCDSVRTGIYITSIHNIDFRQKEYTIDLWMWMRYKNPALDFYNNLEVPQAKTVTKSFATIDSSGDDIYLLMKLQCVMKDSWRIDNFPFDDQILRFSLENSQFDRKAMIFTVDTTGRSFDPRFALSGWRVSQIRISSALHAYETAFGDKHIAKPHMEYSSFRAKVNIGRDAFGLFWKMFLGMYMAFLAAFMCFYIHLDNTDSRFSLSVGGLFAVVGNKYIVDAALPESLSFTLVDLLHGLTLFFIVIVIVCNVISLRLIKAEKMDRAIRFNRITSTGLLISYISLNLFFVIKAMKGW